MVSSLLFGTVITDYPILVWTLSTKNREQKIINDLSCSYNFSITYITTVLS